MIVIDPPWPVAFQARTDAPGQVKFEYTRMSLEKIQALKDDGVLPTMAEHCHVWLWTTQRFLPEAFRCFETWGVRYVCTFVWDKRDGMKPMNLPRLPVSLPCMGVWGRHHFVMKPNLIHVFMHRAGSRARSRKRFTRWSGE